MSGIARGASTVSASDDWALSSTDYLRVVTVSYTNLRELEQQRRQQERHVKKGIRETLSRLFHLIQFLKYWQELNSKRLCRSSWKEKESRCLVFASFIERETRKFHVVVQWRQRNVQKSVMHVQSCCFANLNLLLFWRSRCRRRHWQPL